MEKSTCVIHTIKQWLAYSGNLFCSPFKGALEAMSAALHHPPQAVNWKQLIVNDMHLYFTPVTGAIRGVRNALKHMPEKKK